MATLTSALAMGPAAALALGAAGDDMDGERVMDEERANADAGNDAGSSVT